MALHHPLRLRRALSLSVSLLHRSLHGPVPISSHLLPTPSPTSTPSGTPTASFTQLARPFTSTTALFRKAFDPETDEIGPDTILFEGCDYKHWLITMDFRDSNPAPTRDQMIDTYVNTAAQVFGSVEEAKKKIYALSTTTYQGFQVECSEETSDKFKGIPGVVFVLPDSYIDPANKEYGGDKYINGEIIPRPPPVHYTKRNRDRPRPREQNYGPPPQQNYGPAPQQNYGPAPQQNYGPPPSQNYGPPPSQNYGPPPSQNYGPTPQQNYGRLPQDQGPPPQQNYAPPPQQNYRPPQQQGYAPQPHQSYESPPQQGYAPRVQRGDYFNSPNNASGRGERNYAHGQGDLRSHVPTEQRGFSEDVNSGFSQGGSFEQSGERRNF